MVRSLFDLTVSEARVARRTVRSQLRQILEKTGCGRQAEVVALLGQCGDKPYTVSQ